MSQENGSKISRTSATDSGTEAGDRTSRTRDTDSK
jgi:hypothetical protein